MTRKHIVLYSPTWPATSAANGITTYCASIAPVLEQAGHQVSIVTRKLLASNVDTNRVIVVRERKNFLMSVLLKAVNRFQPGFSQYYSGSAAILDALKRIQERCAIDIFEIEESFGWHAYLSDKVKFPIVVRLHGPHFVNGVLSNKPLTREDNYRFYRERVGLEKCSYVSAPCEWILNLVSSEYECDWTFAEKIFNSVDPNLVELVWDVDSVDFHSILFVGRFDRHKGGDLVIRAFDLVNQKYPEAKLLFAGPDRGVTEAGKSMNFHEYASSVLTEEQLENVIFLGQVERREIIALRQRAHVTVIASRNENFPYTALEALASGSPVVAAEVGGIAEVLEHNVSGLYFEGGNYLDLCDKISQIFSDIELAKNYSKTAKKRVMSTFSVEGRVDETLKFYQKVETHFHSSK